MKKLGLFALIIVGIIAAAGCSGGSTTPADDGNGDETTTRPLSGTIGTANESISGKAESYGCQADICKVIATDTSGGTVMDEDLAECVFELDLEVGKSYMVSFVDCGGEWVAGMSGVLKVEAGEGIELGTITISGSIATSEHPFDEFLDTDGDGTVDSEDEDPCGGVSCDVLYSCKAFGYSDEDGSGICDEFEGDSWGSGSDVSVSCESDSDCGDSEVCALCEDWGMAVCVLQTDICDEEHPCKVGSSCYEACGSPAFGFCYSDTAFEPGCVSNADCMMTHGEGWTCDTEASLSISKHLMKDGGTDSAPEGPAGGAEGGVCAPPEEIACETDEECWMIGGICSEGKCEGGCYSDEQCNGGYCYSGTCFSGDLIECGIDDDCVSGYECMGGMCLFSGACEIDEECIEAIGDPGYMCLEGYCFYSEIPTGAQEGDECTYTYECDGGLICWYGKCQPAVEKGLSDNICDYSTDCPEDGTFCLPINLVDCSARVCTDGGVFFDGSPVEDDCVDPFLWDDVHSTCMTADMANCVEE